MSIKTGSSPFLKYIKKAVYELCIFIDGIYVLNVLYFMYIWQEKVILYIGKIKYNYVVIFVPARTWAIIKEGFLK